jgi:hypothetical protein
MASRTVPVKKRVRPTQGQAPLQDTEERPDAPESEEEEEEDVPRVRQQLGRQPSPTASSIRSSSRLSARRLQQLDQLNSDSPSSALTTPAQTQPNLRNIPETNETDPPVTKKAKKQTKPKSKQLSVEEVDTFRSALPYLQNLGPMIENITHLLADRDNILEKNRPAQLSRPGSRVSSHASSRAPSVASRSSRSSRVSSVSVGLVNPPDLLPQPRPILAAPYTNPAVTQLVPQPIPAAPLHYAIQSLGTDPYSSDLYKRWPWVDKVHITSIIVGELDINNLPKLFRDDQSRRKHNIQTATGMLFPLGGGPAEFVQSQTKLQTVFHNLATFLSAFMIYISIRATFAPEYGSTMSIWVERIISYNAKGPWPPVLAYIIDFFQRHQNAPAAKWLEIDGELVALHFSFANSMPTLSHTPKSPTKTVTQSPRKAQERCKNFNRPNGCTFPASHNGRTCPRLHVCWGCGDANHVSANCTVKPGLPPFNE